MSIHLPFFIARAKLTDPIRLVSVEVDSYPKNSNPFHHNLFMMGTPINDGIIMMHAAGQTGCHGSMEHVNQATGQRFELIPVPVSPEYIEFFYFDELDGELSTRAVFTNSLYSNIPSLRLLPTEWESDSFVATAAGMFVSPVYIVHDKQLVLEDIVKKSTTGELSNLIEKNSHFISSTIDYFETAKKMKAIVE